MKIENNGPFTRYLHTESLGNVGVTFKYYPEERETTSEPYVPAEIILDSVAQSGSEIYDILFQCEVEEIKEGLWKLLDSREIVL